MTCVLGARREFEKKINVIYYTVSGKKRPQYSRHNFDKLSNLDAVP